MEPIDYAGTNSFHLRGSDAHSTSHARLHPLRRIETDERYMLITSEYGVSFQHFLILYYNILIPKTFSDLGSSVTPVRHTSQSFNSINF